MARPTEFRWSDWGTPIPGLRAGEPASVLQFPRDRAAELAAAETMRPLSSRATDHALEPYTLPWFLQVDRKRYSKDGDWLPRLLEFSKHRGEKLLAIGAGLGTDWIRYAEHGTQVTVCSPSSEQLAIVARHFDVRSVKANWVSARPTNIPLPSEHFDLALISDLPFEKMDDFELLIEETYRLLKPGGKILAVLPASQHLQTVEKRFKFWQKREPESSLLRFQAKQLRRSFTDFVELSIRRRHVRRAELPVILRWIPHLLMERTLGRYLIVKGFKPLPVSNAIRLAA